MNKLEIIKEKVRSTNKKLMLFLSIILLLIFSAIISFSCKSEPSGVQKSIKNALLWKEKQAESSDLHELTENYFSENSTSGNAQTYVQSLSILLSSQRNLGNSESDIDFSNFINNLSDSLYTKINSGEDLSPTSVQKSIITIQMCIDYMTCDMDISDGAISSYVNQDILSYAAENTIGKNGIMSYIYGLKMLDLCGLQSNLIQKDDIIEHLLSLQLSDGGFALSGDYGDVDVTAMTLQALAPHYEENPQVTSSVNKALSFLSARQLSGGDFSSYNSPCSESTAQVIIALYKLGIDIDSEEFVKNGNHLTSGLLKYQKKDGSFSHLAGSASDDMATSQALEALSCYADQKGLCVDLSTSQISITNLKLIITITLSVISIIICIFLILKKKKLPQILSVPIIAVIAIILLWTINISSKEAFEKAPSNIIDISDSTSNICISFSISADTIGQSNIYSSSNMYVAEGSTVFEVLSEICRINNIQLDYEDNAAHGLQYIKGINSLYEFDYGDLSGWMYRVNGEFPSVGCGSYNLSEGDKVEWLYTTDLGRDLE